MPNPSYTGSPTADWNLIPPQMVGGLRRYVEHGIQPGHFLTAVLCNDLVEAVARADAYNVRLLANYANFLYNDLPGDCWGSRAKFDAWCKSGGLVAAGWRAPEDAEAI